jgi:NAD-dependent SIR2 family protein deacetylase
MTGPDGYNSMNAKYGGLVKPDVVFFGERLPERFIELGVQLTRFTRTKVHILTQKCHAASWNPAALSY